MADTGNPVGFFSNLGNGIAAPLRYPVFRRIWPASVLSNMGQLIQGVGAAWAMTQLSHQADMVALVQTASLLPIMLIALPAGAIADMYDRRRVAMAALGFALVCASILAIITSANLLTPMLLLTFCFLIGSGIAMFSPAWAASVTEQVPTEMLPAAVALNSISFNIARGIGPAIGGVIVAAAGAIAAFAANALLYIPILIVLLMWRRAPVINRLPPERIDRAVVAGIRYVANSPRIRTVVIRTFLMGVFGASIHALLPLIARDKLHGDASTFGLMLGSLGVGGVIGALNLSSVRKKLTSTQAINGCCILYGLAVLVIGFSTNRYLSAFALMCSGAAWMLSLAFCNVSVQLSVPRWVSGRALASFQAAITGGIAMGAWLWGHVTESHGLTTAFLISGALMLISPLLGYLWPFPPTVEGREDEGEAVADPEVKLALTGRSGPVIVEIEYRITQAAARDFYGVMQKVQIVRQRNGAYNWTIARDVGDPECWMERYQFATWHDYLRHRNRPTAAERDLQRQAMDFHSGAEPVKIHRMLERPFGSVRWKDAAPDNRSDTFPPITSAS